MAKLFKIEGYIVDPNGEFDTKELADIMEYGPYDIHLRHIAIDEADLGEWDDEIDVNYIDCPKAAFQKYFKEKN